MSGSRSGSFCSDSSVAEEAESSEAFHSVSSARKNACWRGAM